MAPSFLYEQTDIPAGMTAAAYRQRRACGLSPLAQRAARLALAARAAGRYVSSSAANLSHGHGSTLP